MAGVRDVAGTGTITHTTDGIVTGAGYCGNTGHIMPGGGAQ